MTKLILYFVSFTTEASFIQIYTSSHLTQFFSMYWAPCGPSMMENPGTRLFGFLDPPSLMECSFSNFSCRFLNPNFFSQFEF